MLVMLGVLYQFQSIPHELDALTRQGLGVSLLPDFAVSEDLALGKLVQIFPTYNLPKKTIFAVHAYDNAPPKSVKAVTEAIQLKLAEKIQ